MVRSNDPIPDSELHFALKYAQSAGSGKSTLCTMIATAAGSGDDDMPDEGEIQVGQTVTLAYSDQARSALESRQDKVCASHLLVYITISVSALSVALPTAVSDCGRSSERGVS